MHPTLMVMFMDAQRAERRRNTRADKPSAGRFSIRHGRDERR